MPLTIRPIIAGDRASLNEILTSTAVFNSEEIAIAMELIDICLTKEGQKDYEIFTAVHTHNRVAGYVCVGPTPATDGTYDLYWIAVKPGVQGKGIGTQLNCFIENHLRSKNGRLLIAETSSTEKYEKTRSFYIRNGYAEIARIKAYYRPEDDLVVYGKYLFTMQVQ